MVYLFISVIIFQPLHTNKQILLVYNISINVTNTINFVIGE